MMRPPFAWFLILIFLAAGLVTWLPFYLGGVHGYQDPALVATLAWWALFALGVGLYRRRGLWLLASPPALFWLFILGTALICDGGGCG